MVDLRDGNEGLKIGSWQISGAWVYCDVVGCMHVNVLIGVWVWFIRSYNIMSMVPHAPILVIIIGHCDKVKTH
jgi:hypothetical protein